MSNKSCVMNEMPGGSRICVPYGRLTTRRHPFTFLFPPLKQDFA